MQAFRAAGVLLVLAAGSAVVRAQAPPAAADLAARIQERYATIRDFTAQFALTQTSGLRLGGGEDRGKVTVKKPGRMRWVFETGDKSEVVADGLKIYSYFPKDKYVHVAEFPAGEQASAALLLLTGRGDLRRDFIATAPAEHPTGEWHLILQPRTAEADFKELTLAVERGSLRLRGLRILDEQGGIRHFRFANLQENRGVADAVFDFRIPKGVEVRR
jgi:outer membrane lipoprotein carrier protein